MPTETRYSPWPSSLPLAPAPAQKRPLSGGPRKGAPPRLNKRQGSSALTSGFGEPHPHQDAPAIYTRFAAAFNLRRAVAAHAEGRLQSGSIQRAAEARDRDDHGERHQAGEREDVELQLGQRRTLEHDRAHDADVVRERQEFADHLRPARHAEE